MRELARLWRLADPNPARFGAAVALALLSLISGLGLLATSAWLISRAAQQPPIMTLQVAIVAVRAFGISRGIFRYAERLVGHDAALRGLANVRVGVFARLERLAPAGLGQYRQGDLLARLVDDVDQSVDLQVRVVLPALASIGAGMLAVALGGALLPSAGWALVVLLLVAGILAPAGTGVAAASTGRGTARAQGDLTARVVATFRNSAEITALGAQEQVLAAIRHADEELTSLARRRAFAAGLGTAISTLATGLTVVACLGLGVEAVRSGALSGVNLAVLALLPLAMADILSGMPAAALARSRVAGSAERIFALVDVADPVRPTKAAAPAAPPQVQGGPGQHDMAATGLSARYPLAGQDALVDIDLLLAGRGQVALVGPSGSGKSTLALALLRMLDPSSGSLCLDGTEVRQLEEDAVRQVVGGMSQDAHLFDTTIRENIRIGRTDASPEQIDEVAVRAHLDGWLAALPRGLDTRVGAHGSAVSGGQARRIALARCLLADRPIQVLDEPGEHLDLATADALVGDLTGTLGDRPTLLITHRLAGIGDFDEVIVLLGGRIVQRGRPADLLEEDGMFADMVRREFGTADPLSCALWHRRRPQVPQRQGVEAGEF